MFVFNEVGGNNLFGVGLMIDFLDVKLNNMIVFGNMSVGDEYDIFGMFNI